MGWGATYYAGPSGSGTDCTYESPCTVKYAVETKAIANDTIVLKDGTYTETVARPQTVNITVNLTIQAENNLLAIWDESGTAYTCGTSPTGDRGRAAWRVASGVTATITGIYYKSVKGVAIITQGGTVTLTNVRSDDAYEAAFQLGGVEGGATAQILTDVDMYRSSAAVNEGCGYSTYPPQLSLKWANSSSVLTRVHAQDGHHEGINIDVGCDGVTGSDITSYYNNELQFYIVSSNNNVFDRLKLLGTATNANGETANDGPCLYFNHEAQWVDEMGTSVSGNKVTNLIAEGCNRGIYGGGAVGRSAYW